MQPIPFSVKIESEVERLEGSIKKAQILGFVVAEYLTVLAPSAPSALALGVGAALGEFLAHDAQYFLKSVQEIQAHEMARPPQPDYLSSLIEQIDDLESRKEQIRHSLEAMPEGMREASFVALTLVMDQQIADLKAQVFDIQEGRG